MKENAPATIYDVARKAGVSTATVSRLINDAASVREGTRKRVLQAIEELNYVPQRGARPGTRDRLPAVLARPPVAFVKIGDFKDPERSPITTRLVEELQYAAERHRLPFHTVDVPEIDPSTTARDLLGDEVKGVFLRTPNNHDVTGASVTWLDGLPAVQVLGENQGSRLWMDHLSPDHATVGIEAAHYLMERGCTPLVYAGSGSMRRLNLDRCTAFVKMARHLGREVMLFHQALPGGREEVEQVFSHLSATRTAVVETRKDLIRQISTDLPHQPFGLFVHSDMLLTVILSQLQIFGGERLPLHAIGCNREPRAFLELETAPATFDLQIDTLAEQAVHRLLRRIQEPDKPFLRISIAPQLIHPVG